MKENKKCSVGFTHDHVRCKACGMSLESQALRIKEELEKLKKQIEAL